MESEKGVIMEYTINMSKEMCNILDQMRSDKSKSMGETIENMMLNYIVMKRQIDKGYRIYLGQDEKNLKFEYSLAD